MLEKNVEIMPPLFKISRSASVCTSVNGLLTVAYAGFFNGGGSVTSHRNDVKYYAILRHHDVTPLAQLI